MDKMVTKTGFVSVGVCDVSYVPAHGSDRNSPVYAVLEVAAAGAVHTYARTFEAAMLWITSLVDARRVV